MRTTATLSALLIGAGCASATRYAGPIPEHAHGHYTFSETVAGSTRGLVLAGEFTVAADTITVTEQSAPCEPVQPADMQLVRYRCGDVLLAFDRRNPAHVTYRVMGYKLESRAGCVGRRVAVVGGVECDRTAEDEVEVPAVLTGYIRAARTSAAQSR